jgi:hypothetical protein
MAIQNYKFVSPGVQVREIDLSGITAQPVAIGPVVIGRTLKGPGMTPTRVNSFSEFVDTFGAPVAGTETGDLWRRYGGPSNGPTYASYAAQAWLKNNQPITVIRLLGVEHPSKQGTAGHQHAGWKTETINAALASDDNGGAYGLWLIPSQSCDAASGSLEGGKLSQASTGTLAAIWYTGVGSTVGSSVRLVGLDFNSGEEISGLSESGSNSTLFANLGPANEFKLNIRIADAQADGNEETIRFNFNENSSNYIRKVFNTSPVACNPNINSSPKRYFLGETFDQAVKDLVGLKTTGECYGVMCALETPAATGYTQADHRTGASPSNSAKSAWIISQHLGTNTDYEQANSALHQKLFRFCTRMSGLSDQHNIKISISDIKAGNTSDPYGTFTVELRNIRDDDKDRMILESYPGCTLNPASPDFIARRIGTQYENWDQDNKRLKSYGRYPNRSKHVRIELNELVEKGALAKETLPFGFIIPARRLGWHVAGSNSDATLNSILQPDEGGFSNHIAKLEGNHRTVKFGAIFSGSHDTTANANLKASGTPYEQATGYNGTFRWPHYVMRVSASHGGFNEPEQPYWGFYTGQSTTNLDFDESVLDVLRALPRDLYAQTFATTTLVSSAFADAGADTATVPVFSPGVFSLDDIVENTGSDGTIANGGKPLDAHWMANSRKGGTSISAGSSPTDLTSSTSASVTDGYKNTLEYFSKFTIPVHGGVDGFDIFEKEPFCNRKLVIQNSLADPSKGNSEYASVQRAIDMMTDPEAFDCNIALMPGVKNTSLNQKLVNACEDRGDCLAIIDLDGGFNPDSENSNTYENRVGNVTNVVNKRIDAQIDSSYGAAYYPWVQINDTLSNNLVIVPPSVIALGVMSNSQKQAQLWFAPAGFNRGGLSTGAAGLNVINVVEKLSSKERDKLYERGINPIASFPSEGVVVFGQKTLQISKSALDRINVRRLLIHIKKEISRMAGSVLFDPNVQVTWNRFIGMAEPFLANIKSNFGLDDYKLVLDASTTTPDLVDRNILYAKVFLKPTKAIEFIAIDFNITTSGASFAD